MHQCVLKAIRGVVLAELMLRSRRRPGKTRALLALNLPQDKA